MMRLVSLALLVVACGSTDTTTTTPGAPKATAGSAGAFAAGNTAAGQGGTAQAAAGSAGASVAGNAGSGGSGLAGAAGAPIAGAAGSPAGAGGSISGAGGSADTVCTPGDVVICECSSGPTGAAICAADGSGYGDCFCDAGGAAGAGGGGGAPTEPLDGACPGDGLPTYDGTNCPYVPSDGAMNADFYGATYRCGGPSSAAGCDSHVAASVGAGVACGTYDQGHPGAHSATLMCSSIGFPLCLVVDGLDWAGENCVTGGHQIPADDGTPHDPDALQVCCKPLPPLLPTLSDERRPCDVPSTWGRRARG